MGAAALGAMAVGGVISAMGSIQGGNAEKKVYNQQADQHDYMANIAQVRTAQEIKQQQAETAVIAGKQAIEYVGGGVGASGSVLQTSQDTAARGYIANANLQFNGDVESYNQRLAGRNARYAGSVAQRAGVMNAATGLLSTGAKMYSLGVGSGGTNLSSAVGSRLNVFDSNAGPQIKSNYKSSM